MELFLNQSNFDLRVFIIQRKKILSIIHPMRTGQYPFVSILNSLIKVICQFNLDVRYFKFLGDMCMLASNLV